MRPPSGLMPRYIWEEKRMIEIAEAIGRYLESKKPIPVEWINEYNELAEKFSE